MRRLFPRLLCTLLAVASVASCSQSVDPKPVSVAGGLKGDLQALRDPNGFFFYPGYYSGTGSIHSTAQMELATDRHLLSESQVRTATQTLCTNDDRHLVVEPWFSWSASVSLGRKTLDAAKPACLSPSPPVATGNPDNDIPMVWAWADSRSRLGAAAASWAPQVEERISKLHPEKVASAYTQWRSDQLESLAGLPDTSGSRKRPAPKSLENPADLLNLWGYTERCKAKESLCQDGDLPSAEDIEMSERYFGDDLSLAAATSILRLRGDHQRVDKYAEAVESRAVPATGLIRSARPEGDVESTFTVLQIAPDLFPGPTPDVTARVATERLALGAKIDVVTRMKTLAILKATGGDAWVAFRPQAQAAAASLTSQKVTAASLKHAIGLIDALRLILPDAPKPELEIFDAANKPSSQLARLALANADMFANGDQIRGAFPPIRKTLISQAMRPYEPVPAYFTTLNAISGARLQSGPERDQQITAGMEQLRGCVMNGKTYDFLYRASISNKDSCSLQATWQAIRSGFSKATMS